MSVRPTEEDFRRHEGTKFRVRVESQRPFELELVKVQGYNPEATEQNNMERYSLFFNGPADMFLPQGVYPFEHPEMGELQLFTVPVGQDERGFQYEVVFNYFKNK